jgi:hypothetical protein
MEELSLQNYGVSSLQPLRGLSAMKELYLLHRCLTSLEGLNSTSLESLNLIYCTSITQLSGVEHMSALKSLRPLSQLGKDLQRLRVFGCRKVREEVLELPHVQPTADVFGQCEGGSAGRGDEEGMH